MFVIVMEVAHPTESVLKTLEQENHAWCERHGIEIRQLELKEIN